MLGRNKDANKEKIQIALSSFVKKTSAEKALRALQKPRTSFSLLSCLDFSVWRGRPKSFLVREGGRERKTWQKNLPSFRPSAAVSVRLGTSTTGSALSAAASVASARATDRAASLRLLSAARAADFVKTVRPSVRQRRS